MSAKIKKHGTSKNVYRPKGVSHHAFKKVYWPYIPLVLVIGSLLVLGFKSGALTQGLRHPGGQVLAYSTSMQSQILLAASNGQREQSHTSDLILDGQLEKAAQAKADDMAKRDYWNHVTPDGSPPWVFFAAADYHYQKAGENLAAGFNNEQSVINAWMASASHRHNLLDPAYRDVGFGMANIADYKAAGGGPMTVVVAFYGDPVGNFDTPAVVTGQKVQPPGYSSTSSIDDGTLGLQKTSRGAAALAQMHLYALATVGIAAVISLSIGLWIGRHTLQFHRVLVKGEKLVFTHPLVDVGLLVTAALAFMLSQTAGLVK